eukprot:TRINITY_DN25913_c0_g1_i1.p1 TRINITY_DN25913_c0_g1~~TRINITY_DN25913_c0_g1_i1.p1  ORF type:complete len:372 (+),score=77.16 TRINITY_DN25913_c0_g1_i1:90-1205(+)
MSLGEGVGFSSLPIELIESTLGRYLTYVDLLTLSLVDKWWLNMTTTSQLWEKLTFRKIKSDPDLSTAVLFIGELKAQPLYFNYKLLHRSLMHGTRKEIMFGCCCNVYVVKVQEPFVVLGGEVKGTVVPFFQVWFYTAGLDYEHVVTVIPATTSLCKVSYISAAVHSLNKEQQEQEQEEEQQVRVLVGSIEGEVDIFEIDALVTPFSAKAINVIHCMTFAGNVGPITELLYYKSRLVTKSALSLRTSEKLPKASISNNKITSSKFKKNKNTKIWHQTQEVWNENEEDDLTYLLKKFSQKLSLSFRSMVLGLSREVNWETNDNDKQFHHIQTPDCNTKSHENDYDIFLWDIQKEQCLAHFNKIPLLTNQKIIL